MKPLPFALTVAILAATAVQPACVAPDDDRPPDIRVVVIETNIPDELQPPCPNRYELADGGGQRACTDELSGPPTVCSSIELCPLQVDAIFSAYLTCEQPEGPVDPDALPPCP